MNLSMDRTYKILVLNIGQTSSKVAYFENEKCINEENVPLPDVEFKSVTDQAEVRSETVENYVASLGMKMEDFDVYVARGNQTPPDMELQSGGYEVTPEYVEMCLNLPIPHPNITGPQILYKWMQKYHKPGYVYDEFGTGDFNGFSKLSGHKDFPLKPEAHRLNQKAAACKCAAKLGGKYTDYVFVVAHLGGGCSVGLHDHGKLVDVTLDAFTPMRMGGMPWVGMINYTKACFSGKYTLNEMIKIQMYEGGLMSYLGTGDIREVVRRIEDGDKEAEFYLNAMAYGQAKDIGSMATAGKGKIDRIILTGGAAHSQRLIDIISGYVKYIAPIEVYAGSFEMEAHATGALRIMRGEEKVNIPVYNKK